MYLLELEAITKQYQQELLQNAEIERLLAEIKKTGSPLQTQLRNQVGDWLISGGLKLKGQPHATQKPAHTLR